MRASSCCVSGGGCQLRHGFLHLLETGYGDVLSQDYQLSLLMFEWTNRFVGSMCLIRLLSLMIGEVQSELLAESFEIDLPNTEHPALCNCGCGLMIYFFAIAPSARGFSQFLNGITPYVDAGSY